MEKHYTPISVNSSSIRASEISFSWSNIRKEGELRKGKGKIK